jgi:hypothetical protein
MNYLLCTVLVEAYPQGVSRLKKDSPPLNYSNFIRVSYKQKPQNTHVKEENTINYPEFLVFKLAYVSN